MSLLTKEDNQRYGTLRQIEELGLAPNRKERKQGVSPSKKLKQPLAYTVKPRPVTIMFENIAKDCTTTKLVNCNRT